MKNETETLRGVVAKLLKLQSQQSKWHDEVEASGYISLNEPISDDYLLLHLALDILGARPESKVNCRDSFVLLYVSMVEERNNIQGYINVVTESGHHMRCN